MKNITFQDINKTSNYGYVTTSNNDKILGNDYINRIKKSFKNWNTKPGTYAHKLKQERINKFLKNVEKLKLGINLESCSLNFEAMKEIEEKYRNGELNKYVKSVYEMFTNKIVTKKHIYMIDPPYASDVNYDELSQFFYAWDKKMLEKVFPDWIKTYEEYKKKPPEDFNKMMVEVWQAIKTQMYSNSVLMIMFASKKEKVWKDLFDGLNKYFCLTSFYPIQVEPPGSLKKGDRYTITMCMTFKHIETREVLNTTKEQILKDMSFGKTDKNCIDWVLKYAKVW